VGTESSQFFEDDSSPGSPFSFLLTALYWLVSNLPKSYQD